MKLQQTDACSKNEHVRRDNTMANGNHCVLDHLGSDFAEVLTAAEPTRKQMWTAILVVDSIEKDPGAPRKYILQTRIEAIFFKELSAHVCF